MAMADGNGKLQMASVIGYEEINKLKGFLI